MLTAAQVKNVKTETKRIKLSDGRGLILIVSPCGGKWWRYRYRLDGKDRQLSLGTYPAMSLSQARTARDQAATLKARGMDPLGEKHEAEAHAKGETYGDTMAALAQDWFKSASTNWTPKNSERVWGRIQNNVLPVIGRRDPRSIEPIDILNVVKPVEERGAIETAHRVRGYCSRIFRYGVASQRADRDPAADIKDAIAVKPDPEHFSAITDPAELGSMMRDIETYRGRWYAIRPALQLMPYLFVRPGTLRTMRWADINLESAQWDTVSGKGKKLRTIVPLSKQALIIISELQQFTGSLEYVFPSPRSSSRMISENALNNALRSMGWGADRVTAHGFRATARTMLDEDLRWRVDWIETQQGHAVRDPNGRAYNRTSFLHERQLMMQAWADYLDALRDSSTEVDPAPYRQTSWVV